MLPEDGVTLLECRQQTATKRRISVPSLIRHTKGVANSPLSYDKG